MSTVESWRCVRSAGHRRRLRTPSSLLERGGWPPADAPRRGGFDSDCAPVRTQLERRPPASFVPYRTFITYRRLSRSTCRLYAYAIEIRRPPEHRFSTDTTDDNEHSLTTHARPTGSHRLAHTDRRRYDRHQHQDRSRPRDVRSGLPSTAREPDRHTQRGDTEDERFGRLNRLEGGNAGSDRDVRSMRPGSISPRLTVDGSPSLILLSLIAMIVRDDYRSADIPYAPFTTPLTTP